MSYVDFISAVHKSTKRDYVARVNEYPKEKAAQKAKTFGYDYWVWVILCSLSDTCLW